MTFKNMNSTRDLRGSLLILGSGPSALSTILGLMPGSKRIFVVDAGSIDQTDAPPKSEPYSHWKPLKLFNNSQNLLSCRSFDERTNIVSENFHHIGSLSLGGLSNIWGGGIIPYDEKDLRDVTYRRAEISDSYSFTYSTLKGGRILTDALDLKHPQTYSTSADESSRMFTTDVAINKDATENPRYCHLRSCSPGCFGFESGAT